MATSTYTPIASITLGSSASSVTFSSIPQDYRDLVLVVDATVNQGGTNDYQVVFNSDTGSNYSQVFAFGNGSTTASSSSTGLSYASLGRRGPTRGVQIWQFMDYSATDKHKTVLDRANSAGDLLMRAVRWANTSGITQIEIPGTGGTIDAGSTFALYGIAS